MPIARENVPHYRTWKWRMAAAYVRWCAHDSCQDCGLTRQAARAANLTMGVAHLNRTPGDDRHENLRYLCAACHLRFDNAANVRTIQINRSRRRHRGQLALIAGARPWLEVER
jgi:hypothetical protein